MCTLSASTLHVILVLRVAAIQRSTNCAVWRKPDLVSHRCRLLRIWGQQTGVPVVVQQRLGPVSFKAIPLGTTISSGTPQLNPSSNTINYSPVNGLIYWWKQRYHVPVSSQWGALAGAYSIKTGMSSSLFRGHNILSQIYLGLILGTFESFETFLFYFLFPALTTNWLKAASNTHSIT